MATDDWKRAAEALREALTDIRDEIDEILAEGEEGEENED